MTATSQIDADYRAAVARYDAAAPASGRWAVQRYEPSKGVYRDELVTDRAALAEHGFRQSEHHRILDNRLMDVAADYAQGSSGKRVPGYYVRSQFPMAYHAETGQTVERSAPPDSAVAEAFRTAVGTRQRRQAVERYPQLAAAFALEASYAKLAQRIVGNGAQKAFVSRMRDNIAADLSKGTPLPEIKLRTDRDVPEHSQAQARERCR